MLKKKWFWISLAFTIGMFVAYFALDFFNFPINLFPRLVNVNLDIFNRWSN